MHNTPSSPPDPQSTWTSSSLFDQDSSSLTSIEVPFVWKHGGHEVYLAGDFTNWQKSPIPLIKKGPFFQQIIRLEFGEHLFKFIVDGRWCYDPDLATRIDPHGNVNNVVMAELPRLEQKQNTPPHLVQIVSGLPPPQYFNATASLVEPAQQRHFLNRQPPDPKFYKNLVFSPDEPRTHSTALKTPPPTMLQVPYNDRKHIGYSQRESGRTISLTTVSYPLKGKCVSLVYYDYL